MGLTVQRRAALFASGGVAGYNGAVAALSPDSYWKQNETSGTTLVDSGTAGKNLTLGGSGFTLNQSVGLAGVGNGINYGNGNAYAVISAALTQVTANKLSVAGWFLIGAGGIPQFTSPIFCASVAAGHVDPFYSFFLGSGASGTNWRIALATGGAFAPIDTGVAVMSTGTWHHVALVYDGTLGTNTVFLYVDGSQVYNGTNKTGNIGAMGSFGIDTIPAIFPTGPFLMSSSSLAYWHNTALSAGNISTLYAARNG